MNILIKKQNKTTHNQKKTPNKTDFARKHLLTPQQETKDYNLLYQYLCNHFLNTHNLGSVPHITSTAWAQKVLQPSGIEQVLSMKVSPTR